jgi:hypothetical protein
VGFAAPVPSRNGRKRLYGRWLRQIGRASCALKQFQPFRISPAAGGGGRSSMRSASDIFA